MLTLQVHAQDLAQVWHRCDDGLRSGDSRIRGFVHPSLEHGVLSCGRATALVWREAGKTPLGDRTLSPAGFRRALDALRRWPLHWNIACIDHETRTLRLYAGGGGNAAVFLLATDDLLRGNWDPDALLPEVKDINAAATARFLSDFDMAYGPRTMFEGLELVTAGSQVDWRPGQALAHHLPTAAPAPSARKLRPDQDPVQTALNVLNHAIARITDHAQRPGVRLGSELSGGLDSALISIMASQHVPNIQTFGLKLPGMDGQVERRQAVITKFGLRDTLQDLSDNLPFCANSPRWFSSGCIPWEETYAEAVNALLAEARAQGVTTMLTGFGGDELCGLHPGEPPPPAHLVALEPASQTAVLANFLTPEAQALSRGLRPIQMPMAEIDSSSLETMAFSAALYMRHGIWPVHPFCAAELARFCTALPWEWRVGRRIERDMLRAVGCPSDIIDCRTIDSFLPALAQAMRAGDADRFTALFDRTELAERGLIDERLLKTSFAQWCRDGADEQVIPYYSVACMELALRQTGMAR